MNLSQAQTLASQIIELLAPACEKIEVAGSVRRLKPEPGDIEIVALPIVAELPGFFGVTEPFSRLELRIRELLGSGTLVLDQVVKRNGAKAKRFVVMSDSHWLKPTEPIERIAIDLFIADRDNYGDTMAIRTGDSDFSHALVTERRYGGLMPSYLKHHDGYLWRGIEKLACPTEEDFFHALGLRWVEPQFRNASVVRELVRHSEESKS